MVFYYNLPLDSGHHPNITNNYHFGSVCSYFLTFSSIDQWSALLSLALQRRFIPPTCHWYSDWACKVVDCHVQGYPPVCHITETLGISNPLWYMHLTSGFLIDQQQTVPGFCSVNSNWPYPTANRSWKMRWTCTVRLTIDKSYYKD